MARRVVMHVIDTDGPGGAETVLASLMARIPRGEFESVAVVPGSGDWLKTTLSSSGATVELARTSWPEVRAFDVRYLRRLAELIRKHRPSVVHAHSLGAGYYSALALLLGASGARLVVTLHGATDLGARGRLRSLKWFLLRRASAVVCVSESLRQQALAIHGIVPERVIRIYNGVDAHQFAPGSDPELRNRLDLSPDTFLLGAVGNVRPTKSYETLLHAVAAITASGHAVFAAIAGDDALDQVPRLTEIARSHGIADRVRFLGFTENIAGFLHGIDVLALSSSSEGFSLAVAQAQACGIPVVSTRCGGPEEIVSDEESGLLVPPDDPVAFARAVERLLLSSALRVGMSVAARDRAVRLFSLETMIREYSRLYRSVCDSTRG